MPGRGQNLAAVVNVDIRPVREGRGDLLIGLGIRGGDVAERLIREHDAPAEGVVRLVALEDADLVPGVPELR